MSVRRLLTRQKNAGRKIIAVTIRPVSERAPWPRSGASPFAIL